MDTMTIQRNAQGLALKDSFIGRDTEGRKYYLSAEIKGTTHTAQTVNHETIEAGAPLLTLSGVIVSKYGSIRPERAWESCGQVLDQFDSVTRFEGRWNKQDLSAILSIWAAYHLNDMNSHCAHQDSDIKWDKVEPCPLTGYKAGSAWLYAPIHDYALIRLTGLILANRGGE